MKLNCIICSKEFTRNGKQAKVAKCCSFKCLSVYNTAKPNCKCDNCRKDFHKKESHKTKTNFCSVKCMGEYRTKSNLGSNNPNFRNRMYDDDGYRLINSEKYGNKKLHHVIAYEILGISSIPKGYHIHHRDCNHLNNNSENLVLLSISEHRWLHAQFGNATLWAYMNNKISLENLCEWSNDREKALRLLSLSLKEQIGVFKSDKLLENPEEDNQQPITTLNE